MPSQQQPSRSSVSPSSNPKHDPLQQQMADDLREIRRKQSLDVYAPGIGVLILIGLAWWFLHQ